VENFFNNLDPASLALLIVCALALFTVGKWATRVSESNQLNWPEEPNLGPSSAQQSLFPVVTKAHGNAVSAREAELGPIRIIKFYFSKFDLVHGPADPEAFYDELFVELYDANSGHRWTQSYGVATPEGLRQILHDKSWSYLYANGIIVVQKYDLNPIREAVIARITEDNELFKPMEKVQEESL
jgi:hypothetical protein